MATGNFEMRQKRNAVLSELLDRVAFLGLAATPRSTAIKDDGMITLAEHRHYPNVPGRRRPPRRRHEHDRFAPAPGFIVDFYIAQIRSRHFTPLDGLSWHGHYITKIPIASPLLVTRQRLCSQADIQRLVATI